MNRNTVLQAISSSCCSVPFHVALQLRWNGKSCRMALAAVALALFGEREWAMYGAIASVVVLALVAWEIVLQPTLRRVRLKHPCRAHFVIREIDHVPVSYVVQDDQMHHVRELVLPSNADVEIEIGYFPRIHFHEVGFVFACEGDAAERPFAKERFTRFIKVGKSHWVPGVDTTDTIDVHGFYHVKREMPRNVGTHFVNGFKLQTRRAGVYPVVITFLTEEIEGTVRLTIRVEDKPKTLMRCCKRGHSCVVRPRPLLRA